jgi:hypothetical protein
MVQTPFYTSKQTSLKMEGVNLGYSEYINNYYDGKYLVK